MKLVINIITKKLVQINFIQDLEKKNLTKISKKKLPRVILGLLSVWQPCKGCNRL